MRTLLAFALMCSAAVAQTSRVPLDQLPDFTGKFYCTVIFSALPTERDVALAELLRTDESMQRLTEQTIFNSWKSDTAYLQTPAWQAFLGDRFPAILLQAPSKPNGSADVVFYTGGDFLTVGPELPKQIQSAVDKYVSETIGQDITLDHNPACPDGRCPYQIQTYGPFRRQGCPDGNCPLIDRRRQQYQPKPAPQVTPRVTPQVTPPVDVKPLVPTITEPEEVDEPEGGGATRRAIPVFLLLIPIVTAGLGIRAGYKS